MSEASAILPIANAITSKLHVISYIITVPIAIAFDEAEKGCDYRKCGIMENTALLSIRVNVLLLLIYHVLINTIISNKHINWEVHA